jgi:hypothetical protein
MLNPGYHAGAVMNPRPTGSVLDERRQRKPSCFAGRKLSLKLLGSEPLAGDAEPVRHAVEEGLRVSLQVIEDGDTERVATEMLTIAAQVSGVPAFVDQLGQEPGRLAEGRGRLAVLAGQGRSAGFPPAGRRLAHSQARLRIAKTPRNQIGQTTRPVRKASGSGASPSR